MPDPLTPVTTISSWSGNWRSKPLRLFWWAPSIPMKSLDMVTMQEKIAQRLWSFKEIDTLHQQPKGTAFRAFKQQQDLMEGEHYHYLSATTHTAEIESLRRAGRIYKSTVNAVLLTEAGYALLLQALTD